MSAPHFSTFAILALLGTTIIGSVILIHRYPDGLNDADGMPSLPLTLMVCSACFGCVMTVFMTLVFAGQITFDI